MTNKYMGAQKLETLVLFPSHHKFKWRVLFFETIGIKKRIGMTCTKVREHPVAPGTRSKPWSVRRLFLRVDIHDVLQGRTEETMYVALGAVFRRWGVGYPGI